MVQTRKDNAALAESRCLGLALGDDLRLDVIRNGSVELPSGHLGVLLAGRAGRSAKGVDLKVRVGGEELDEPLTDGSGRAEDTDLDLGLGSHVGGVLCITNVFIECGQKPRETGQGR